MELPRTEILQMPTYVYLASVTNNIAQSHMFASLAYKSSICYAPY